MNNRSENIQTNNRRAAQIRQKLPEYIIDAVSFHPFSLEEQRKFNVCQINNTELYAIGGVNDPRMGVSEEYHECETCHQDIISCTGHQGAIELNKPIINPFFLKNVIFILKCVCNSCGELMIPDEVIQGVKVRGPARLKLLSELATVCTGGNVQGCKSCIVNPGFVMKKSKNLHFLMTEYIIKQSSMNGDKPVIEKKKINLPMDVDEVIPILMKISESRETMIKLGFVGKTRPIDYIIRDFNVISLCNRGPRFFNGGSDPQDDPITISYKDLVAKNEKLNQDNDDDFRAFKQTEYIRDMWVHAIHIMDNSYGTHKHGKSEPVKGIKEQLKEKNGLPRTSQNKRDDYTARTVAGPSHSSNILYVEVPDCFRQFHTVAEKVTRFNIRRILDLLDKGEIYSIKKHSGPRKDRELGYTADNVDFIGLPAIGDIVRRWGQTGDMIMFGRNPTLSKFSNVAAMVLYVKKKTIGTSCPPAKQFNMDFDGDEVHINMPQGIGTRVEAKFITFIRNCVMSFKGCKPNIAIYYNGLSSGHLLSKDADDPNGFRIDLEDWDIVCAKLEHIDHIPWTPKKNLSTRRESLFKRLALHGVDVTSPRALFSIALPENLNYDRNGLIIIDGVLISGTLSAKNIGSSPGCVIHFLHKNYGSKPAFDFISDANFVLEYYLYRRGFTVTFRDVASSNITEIKKKIQQEKSTIQSKIDTGSLSDDGIKNLVAELSKFSDKMVFGNIKPSNPLKVMADSGAKGNSRNLMQICGALGQQFLYGKMPERNLTCGKRCSPFHRVNSTDIAADGFIENSFLTGLSPSEMLFHIIASRVGLIDTSVKTAETGHMSRKFHRCFDDYMTRDDCTIRGVGNKIVSFFFLDGFATETMIPSHYNELGKVCSPVDMDFIIDYVNRHG